MSQQFIPLRILDVRQEGAEAISVQFEVPLAERDRFAFRPGQHLTLRSFIDGEDVRRNYSLCSAPFEDTWRVAIKRIPNGRFSNWANDVLKGGQAIDVLPPTGSFAWTFEADASRNYALFAAGSGITPILALLKQGLKSETTSHFALFYGNRDSDSILFLEEIAALKDRYTDRLSVHHFLSREVDEIALFNGRIDPAKMAEINAHLIDVQRLDTVFVCGPEGLLEVVSKELVEAGFGPENILSERFAAGELTDEQRTDLERLERQAAGKRLKVTMDGRTRLLEFDPGTTSILDNVRAAGMRAPFSCKAGVCATCRAKVTSGEVTMIRNFGLSTGEVEDGFVLTCQAVPTSDEVVLSFDI